MESKSREQLLRDEFEAWAEEVGALPWGYLKKQRNPSGGYSVQIYTYMWEAWQASRSALVVELPKDVTNVTNKPYEEGRDELIAEAEYLVDYLKSRIAGFHEGRGTAMKRQLTLAQIALAALTAEPIGFITETQTGRVLFKKTKPRMRVSNFPSRAVFVATPVPVIKQEGEK